MDNASYPGSDLGTRGFSSRKTNSSTHTADEYEVIAPKGITEWPSKEELINFCNRGPSKFGGTVQGYYYMAVVRVYIE